MEQKPNIQDILFPTELRPIFFGPSPTHQMSLFEAVGESDGPIPGYQALIDLERKRVLSVVSSRYRLVTNQEAIEMGKECFKGVFDTPTADEMQLFNIIMSKNRTFCHVDFIHPRFSIQPFTGDFWKTFIRITNSYNRTKPLSFDVGFCRAICTNGAIMGKTSAILRYYHTTGTVPSADKGFLNDSGKGKNLGGGPTIDTFSKDVKNLKELQNVFLSHIRRLVDVPVPPQLSLALVCQAFKLKLSREDFQNPRKLPRLLEFRDHIDHLTELYFKEIGSNAYAAYNVLTDFASRPSFFLAENAMIHGLQRACGSWIADFVRDSDSGNFDLKKYLGDFLGPASDLARVE